MSKRVFLKNDNELLYLIKNKDDDALAELFDKYEPLIKSKINKYNFPVALKDDCLQEGKMALLKAIDTYNEAYNKTFNKYFDLLLTNKFNDLYKKNQLDAEHLTVLKEDVIDSDAVSSKDYFSKNDVVLSKQEKIVFEEHFINGKSTDEIAANYNLSKKSVYNAVQRIKQKYAKMRPNK